ncbi:hypothetical protein Ahy_B02g061063 [Arachis hypogaea]|uniref:Reverse transcriptase zinc-binding domain-containing protein n=1 Tax=Arachis hypogaea TaxID=3818 RepID=A0A445AJY5_ARAHY|nr:hypothetical protein Ahy_B02g061063 [Arachis hypogaea]
MCHYKINFQDYLWFQIRRRTLYMIVGVDRFIMGNRDNVTWRFSSDGRYNVKSFTNVAEEKIYGETTMKHIFYDLWRGLVRLRIEMLVWFIITDGLNTKDKLIKKEIISQGEGTCVLCKKKQESVSHLFLHCSFCSKLWFMALNAGRVCWIEINDIRTWFEGWINCDVCNMPKKRIMLFFAILWTSMGEALLSVLQMSLQFGLKEVGVKEEDVKMMANNKYTVKWLHEI